MPLQKHRSTRIVASICYGSFKSLQGTKWRIKSPYDDGYQCIAWASWYNDRHMWPHANYWWFPGAPLFPGLDFEATLPYFVEGFSRIGYKPIGKENRRWVPGFQKLAIYANDAGVTHMARQHFLGCGWLSKLGRDEDIAHRKLEDIEGDTAAIAGSYGKVAEILRRSWWSALKHDGIARALKITREMREYRRTHKWDKP